MGARGVFHIRLPKQKLILKTYLALLQSEVREQSSVQLLEKGDQSAFAPPNDAECPDTESPRAPPSPTTSTPRLGTQRRTLFI